MTIKPLPRPLRGIVPPLVTPLNQQDQLDVPGLQRLIERMLQGGVHGLFALGTTGEGPSLDHALRHQVVEIVCDQVSGRVPVLVGITDTSLTEALELAERSYAAGASALVTAAPYYLPMSQEELCALVERMAGEVRLPLFLYNMPSCTKTGFAVETVLRLSQLDNVVGLKDSSGDLEYFARILRCFENRPDFTVLIGPEELLAESLTMGGHGGVSGGANMFPHLYVALYEAVTAKSLPEADRLHEMVMRVSHSIYSVGDNASRVVKGIKCALKWLDVCDDYVAAPFCRFEGPRAATIGRHVQELSALLSREGRQVATHR